MLVAQSHSGPLPSAAEFRRYNIALPGAAERILAMTEREQAHRHVLEDKVVGTEGWVKIAGQWFAIFALILSLFVVALFAYWDHPKEGAALGVTIIVGVVALFLGRGRWRGASTAPADEE